MISKDVFTLHNVKERFAAKSLLSELLVLFWTRGNLVTIGCQGTPGVVQSVGGY